MHIIYKVMSIAVFVRGISFSQLLGIKKGILVLDVPPDSAAQQAGLRGTTRGSSATSSSYFGPPSYDSIVLGDIIVAMDADAISNEADLFRAIEKHKVGDVVSIKVLRAVEQSATTELDTTRKERHTDQGAILDEGDDNEFSVASGVSFREVTIQLKLSSPQLEAI